MKKLLNCSLFLFLSFSSYSQLMVKKELFTKADTLRGSLNENRDWFDVLKYDITVEPNIEQRTIEGKTIIQFKTLVSSDRIMQVDLQDSLIIDSVIYQNEPIQFAKNSKNVWYVYFKNLPESFVCCYITNITIYYHGKPQKAINPPWVGGWIWKKDKNNNPWVSVACEGLGASSWFPCKDHLSDEPDSGASLTIIVPDTLVAVANGKNISTTHRQHQSIYTWQVKNPINTYNIIPYIGKYVNFSDTLQGEKGTLQLNYWVLNYDLEKAKEQFKQVKLMLRAFEYWFGAYPFYEDGYQLVAAPHLGMEHQSAIAYGNKYQNGYLGRDLSGTGWGNKWDFIIVHESGHEWFGNNISCKDIADMWIHEGFTCYSETLFTEYYYGKEAGNEYNKGLRRNIINSTTIIGNYGVNKEGSGDMYNKAANMIHSIRHAMNNDSLFREMLRYLGTHFYHQTVTTKEIEDVVSEYYGSSLQKVFDQYLRTTQIPTLEYYFNKNMKKLFYRWSNCVDGFDLKLVLNNNNQTLQLLPVTKWQSYKLKSKEAGLIEGKLIEQLYYINKKEVKGK